MLKYVGKGFLTGVPARDLSDKEVEDNGGEEFLISTGLYAKPEVTKKTKTKEKEGE